MSAVPSFPAQIRREPNLVPRERARVVIEDRECWPVRAPRRDVAASARVMRRAGRVA